MIEAEFLVQALQMRHQIWAPNFFAALGKLRAGKVIEKADAEKLRAAYTFLRSCESVLRRWQNRSVSTLPATHDGQLALARRMKFSTIEAFHAPYRQAREVIRALWMRYLT